MTSTLAQDVPNGTHIKWPQHWHKMSQTEHKSNDLNTDARCPKWNTHQMISTLTQDVPNGTHIKWPQHWHKMSQTEHTSNDLNTDTRCPKRNTHQMTSTRTQDVPNGTHIKWPQHGHKMILGPVKEMMSVVCLLDGCWTPQQCTSISQRWIWLDNFSCCHTETEVEDETGYLTWSQYTDTGTTSSSTDPAMLGTWQGSHVHTSFEVPGLTVSGKGGDRSLCVLLAWWTPHHQTTKVWLCQGRWGSIPVCATGKTDTSPPGHQGRPGSVELLVE